MPARAVTACLLATLLCACGGDDDELERANIEIETAAPGPFQIRLEFMSDITPRFQSAFQSAANRWGTVIRNDLPNRTFNLIELPSVCGFGNEARTVTVDDVLIAVEVREIDGEAGVLGQAGPCILRATDRSPLVGFMEFDSADLSALDRLGRMEEVILHEMGHVLGIGTLWQDFLENPSFPNQAGADTRFVGPRASAAYQTLGGSLDSVPVENNGVSGSADGHWRESTFRNELMSPRLSLNDVTLPLSSVTIASLSDLGFYEVDSTASDPFELASPLALSQEPDPDDRLEHGLILPEFVMTPEGVVQPSRNEP